MDSGNEDGKSKNPQEHHEDAAGSSRSEHSQEHLEDAAGSSRSEHPQLHLEDASVSSRSDHLQEHLEDAAGGSRSDPQDHLEDATESSRSEHPQEHLDDAAGSSRSDPEIISLDSFHITENSESIELYPKVIDRSRSSEIASREGEVNNVNGSVTEGGFFTKKFGSFSFSSSRSLSTSSSEDLFQVDTNQQEHLEDTLVSSRSEHPQDHLEDATKSSRSEHPQEHLNDASGGSRSDHPEIIPLDSFHVTENSESIELYPKVIDRSRSGEIVLREGEVDDVNGSVTEGGFFTEKVGSFSFSSSRSLSISSSEDLFQVITNQEEHLEDAVGSSRSKRPQDHLDDAPGSSRSEHPQHLDDAPGSSRSEDPGIISLDSFQITEKNEGSELYPKVIDGSRSSETALREEEVNNVKRSLTAGGFYTAKYGSFSFSSSRSMSTASSEDLFEEDTNNFNPSSCVSFSHKPSEGSKPVLECNIRHPGTSSSQVSDSNHNPETRIMSPTQTPPIQIMDRSEGHNSSRIPNSVFERNSLSPMEWSYASNDSLFSLHLGNPSFAREKFLSSELRKSVDFEKSSIEIDKSGEPHNKSGEFIVLNPPTPVLASEPALELDRKSVEKVMNSEPNKVVDEPITDATQNTAEEQKQNQVKQKLQPQVVTSNTPGNLSYTDGSSSSRSLATPTTKKKRKSKCLFCYCTLPTCYIRWPSCYFPDCSYSWICSRKGLCCCSCIWTSKSKNGAYEEDLGKPPKHQPLQQNVHSESPSPKAHPKSSAYKCHNCFPCFYSCGRCSCYRCC